MWWNVRKYDLHLCAIVHIMNHNMKKEYDLRLLQKNGYQLA